MGKASSFVVVYSVSTKVFCCVCGLWVRVADGFQKIRGRQDVLYSRVNQFCDNLCLLR